MDASNLSNGISVLLNTGYAIAGCDLHFVVVKLPTVPPYFIQHYSTFLYELHKFAR